MGDLERDSILWNKVEIISLGLAVTLRGLIVGEATCMRGEAFYELALSFLLVSFFTTDYVFLIELLFSLGGSPPGVAFA